MAPPDATRTTLPRPALITAAVALVAASIGALSPAAAAPRTCRPAGAKVLLASSAGTLYKAGKTRHTTRYVVCRGQRSKRLVLGGVDCFNADAPSLFAIAGRWLGYVNSTCDSVSGGETVVVVDLRKGKRHDLAGPSDTPAAVADPYDTVQALAVAPSGAAAWVMSYAGADIKDRIYEVRRAIVGQQGSVLLDSGRDVVPTSLAVSTDIVYWTRGGTPRSGSLR